MINGIYGINIAVKDLKAATDRYEKVFGVKAKHLAETDFAFPNLLGSEFNLGEVKINLITSKTEDTSIGQFLSKKGEGLFLFSLKVSNIEEDMNRMKEGGASFVSPSNFTGAFGKVNFIHPKSMNGVQIEVLELPKN